MKKLLAIAMLASLSFAHASEIVVKEISSGSLKKNSTLTAEIAVQGDEAGVLVKSTSVKKVGPRNARIKNVKKSFITVPELRLEGDVVMFESVECGKLIKKKNPGPRATGSRTILKFTGSCDVELRQVADSVQVVLSAE